jgi:transketolase
MAWALLRDLAGSSPDVSNSSTCSASDTVRALHGNSDRGIQEDTFGFHLAGMVGHDFFKPYAVTFDFENMQILLK